MKLPCPDDMWRTSVRGNYSSTSTHLTRHLITLHCASHKYVLHSVRSITQWRKPGERKQNRVVSTQRWFCNQKMLLRLDTLALLIIVPATLIITVNGLWIRGRWDEEEDEDVFMTLEDKMGDNIFNSRGPRSLYRGLEDEGDMLLDYSDEQSYDYGDFDYEFSLFRYNDWYTFIQFFSHKDTHVMHALIVSETFSRWTITYNKCCL